ncbi:MAG: radical SAM family heme chaperone HemW [Pseudomonadota bacterium]|nr:radical SAM family heme chaperone HemW [Pseudomonadota bacterium]
MTPATPRLALYVHWPFCRAKCPYCDFNSHVADEIDHARFAAAYRREMEHMAALHGGDRQLETIFFGGGTPSLMPPWLIAGIIEDASSIFGLAPGIEITAEANPTSSEAALFSGFRDAGVNRLSLGVQSLRDDGLAFLGREHSAKEAIQALRAARHVFERVSIDLIYARQGQSLDDWHNELGMALDLGLDHLSLYQLTIEAGTHFYSRARRGEVLTADDALAADMYEATGHIMDEAGLPAYEISNHARPGAECRHNLVYWQAEDWIGTGPGAHGRISLGQHRRGLATRRSPIGWLEAVEANGHAIETSIDDGPEDAVAERLMMGLRLASGLDLGSLTSRFGDLSGLIDKSARDELVAAGLLADDPKHLRTTEAGRLLLNRILAELLPAG